MRITRHFVISFLSLFSSSSSPSSLGAGGSRRRYTQQAKQNLKLSRENFHYYDVSSDTTIEVRVGDIKKCEPLIWHTSEDYKRSRFSPSISMTYLYDVGPRVHE